jgi:hypothetical protein
MSGGNAAFVHAMNATALVGAGVALAGTVVALAFLLAHAPKRSFPTRRRNTNRQRQTRR